MQETIEEQYPVNLSLDLNCSSGHSRNPLRTSVNVTVRTPVGSPLQPAAAGHHQTSSPASTSLPHHQHPVSHHQQIQVSLKLLQCSFVICITSFLHKVCLNSGLSKSIAYNGQSVICVGSTVTPCDSFATSSKLLWTSVTGTTNYTN